MGHHNRSRLRSDSDVRTLTVRVTLTLLRLRDTIFRTDLQESVYNKDTFVPLVPLAHLRFAATPKPQRRSWCGAKGVYFFYQFVNCACIASIHVLHESYRHNLLVALVHPQ